MAPALVEHSAAKERNSISKEYSNFTSCWSQFDFELFGKYRNEYLVDLLETNTLPELNKSSYLEMNHSDKKKRQDISFAENKNAMVSFKEIITFPNLKGVTCDAKTGYKNGTLNYKFEKIPKSAESTKCMYSSKNITTREDCITAEDRPPQPIASMDNINLVNYLQTKEDSCGTKFSNMNKSMDKLNQRLRQLQSKNVFSHVSAHVSRRDKCEKLKSSDKMTEPKKKGDFPGIDIATDWEDLQKIYDMVRFKADDTECEDDLEIHPSWQSTVSKRKKKSDNPPPSVEALHQWKIKRAYIGSQCSWLSLKISTLDKTISELDELHEKLRLEKKKSKVDKNYCNEDDNVSTSETKCEGNAAQPSTDEQMCCRVLPYTNIQSHEYIKVKQNAITPVYKCRCLPSVSPCYRCLHSQNHSSRDTRNARTGKLDRGFHPILSYENEVSLSFLLEEVLRKQRINTKVTISKTTKKKKKQKTKEGGKESSEKCPPGNKGSRHASEKNHARSKSERSERQKFDELPRKRGSALEPSGLSGRTRKSRKLSESEESWKPGTPTELNSPFSQNHPSSAFFPLKRKKNSSGADYDINNIVIPYSMAASTRVERIQYKEIPTPGWRSINCTSKELDELDEYETTDDEAYLDRHMRCEMSEKRKFTDYYQPVLRRRPYHLSESTASGPPSPLVSDEFRPSVHTPIDSPLINPSTTASRSFNVILVPDEEREPCWTFRTYPLHPNEVEKLSTPTTATSSASTTSDCSTTNNDILTTSKHVPAPTASTSSTHHSSKHSVSSSSPVVSVTTKETVSRPPLPTPSQTPLPTPLQTPSETPSRTPIETRMSSPLRSSDDGTLSSATDGTGHDDDDPDKWTVKKVVKEDTLDAVTTEEQQRAGGIVLKLAKK